MGLLDTQKGRGLDIQVDMKLKKPADIQMLSAAFYLCCGFLTGEVRSRNTVVWCVCVWCGVKEKNP